MPHVNGSYLLTEDKLNYLRENETINNLAYILSLTQSKQYKDNEDKDRYYGILDCIKANHESLKNFEIHIEGILNLLQKIKTYLYEKNVFIRINKLNDEYSIKKQFNSILKNVAADILSLRNSVDKIRNLNPELLYCLYNVDIFGSTQCGDLDIKGIKYNNFDEYPFKIIAQDRILKFKLGRLQRSLSHEIFGDYDLSIYERDEENYNSYTYSDQDYINVNSMFCNEIISNIKNYIKYFRDGCRRINHYIGIYKLENKHLSDPKYKQILSSIQEKLTDNKKLQNAVDSNLRGLFSYVFRLIYDYKKEVEESEWKTTCNFGNESYFKEHIYNYLNRTRKAKLNITKESEKTRGRVDIQIDNRLVLELKLIKGFSNEKIKGFIPQIREVMENWSNNLGFLILLDKGEQKDHLASKENYFKVEIYSGGKGVNKKEDISPLGIVCIAIFGGKRLRPSVMK